MADNALILVIGAAGQLGAVGRTVTGLFLERGLPVRAMVRREDDRAAALRAAGAEVVVGDLLDPADVVRVVSGCRRVYFGMSVSPGYLEATVTMVAVARDVGVEALVNMSQMTVSQMSLQHTTPSRQQRQHWLSEQALAWSGLRRGMRLHGGDLDRDEARAPLRTPPIERKHALRRRSMAVDKAGEADRQAHHAIPHQQARDPQRLEHQGTLIHRGAPCPVRPLWGRVARPPHRTRRVS